MALFCRSWAHKPRRIKAHPDSAQDHLVAGLAQCNCQFTLQGPPAGNEVFFLHLKIEHRALQIVTIAHRMDQGLLDQIVVASLVKKAF